jgi:tetratricopeptide (TPR) repeat protein
MTTDLKAKTVLSSPTTRLGASPDRLDSWKEIASYLKREVRTVQLWEKREGMPVHRHFHRKLGTVFAFRSEIEEWSKHVSRGVSAGDAEDRPRAEGSAAPLRSTVIEIEVPDLASIGRHRELRLLAEEVLTRLQRLEQYNVVVTRPQSARKLASAGQHLSSSDRPIAKYVVDWKMTGEFGSAFGLQVNLMAGLNGPPVWAHNYPLPADAEDCCALADRIVQCIWLKIVSFSRSANRVVYEEKASARGAYLRGRYFQNQRNEGGLHKAAEWFRKAIELDSRCAPAHSGLADTLTLLAFYEFVSPFQAIPEARRAALRAIEFDADLAEGHASLADIHFHFDRDWSSADRQYRRAIECDPSYALGYHWYANLLTARGQHEAAQTAIMHAVEIDPVSVITQVWAGVTSHLANHFDEAIGYYRSALELDPSFACAHMYLAQTLEQTGEFGEALAGFDTAMQLTGGSRCIAAMKAHTHAIAGDHNSAQQMLGKIVRSENSQCMPSYDIAAAYAALGEFPKSFEWLRRACLEHNMRLYSLAQDPRFDRLRYRPEFREIVARIGLSS